MADTEIHKIPFIKRCESAHMMLMNIPVGPLFAAYDA